MKVKHPLNYELNTTTEGRSMTTDGVETFTLTVKSLSFQRAEDFPSD